MNNKKPENPSAFPTPSSDIQMGEYGMSLRDYFAAKAMQAAISNDSMLKIIHSSGNSTEIDPIQAVSIYAYEMADKMLEQRDS